MPARSDSLSARRRFLLIVAVLLCAAAGGWYCFRPPADGAGAALARARSAIERADWDVAQAELEALYRLRPGDCEVLQFAAEVAQRRGDTAASIAWLERIPESDIRVFAESRLQAARLAMQAGRPQKTEELLLSALRKDARLADARRLLVRLDLLLLRDTRMREEIVVLDEQGAATWHDLLLFTVGSRAGWATNAAGTRQRRGRRGAGIFSHAPEPARRGAPAAAIASRRRSTGLDAAARSGGRRD